MALNLFRLAAHDRPRCTMTDNGDIFRERIREVTQERIGDYLPNQRNPKIHGELQNERLRAILENWGKVGVLLTFKDDDGRDVVFDGHARRNQNPDETWYIAKTDLTRQEANELVLMYDPIAALATMDRAQMDGLLKEVKTTDASLTAMLSELAADNYLTVPDEFKEYDESVADEVEYLECPECGHKWPK